MKARSKKSRYTVPLSVEYIFYSNKERMLWTIYRTYSEVFTETCPAIGMVYITCSSILTEKSVKQYLQKPVLKNLQKTVSQFLQKPIFLIILFDVS
jgi:hypothetical protein